MRSEAARSVESYVAGLPEPRREALSALRQVIRKHLPWGYEEGMSFGMPSYHVPLSRYPRTYNGQPLTLAAFASQKNHMSLYLMGVYGDRDTERWLSEAFRQAGKRLDMGKSCLRFTALEQLPLDVIGEVIGRVTVEAFIARYEASRGLTSGKAIATKSAASAPTPAKKPAGSKQVGARPLPAAPRKRSKKSASRAKAGPAQSRSVKVQRRPAKGRSDAAAVAEPAAPKQRRAKPRR